MDWDAVNGGYTLLHTVMYVYLRISFATPGYVTVYMLSPLANLWLEVDKPKNWPLASYGSCKVQDHQRR